MDKVQVYMCLHIALIISTGGKKTGFFVARSPYYYFAPHIGRSIP